MHTGYLRRAFSILVLVHMALSAQVSREHETIPLKHWPAPLYWQALQPQQDRTVTSAVVPAFLVFVAMTPCRLVDTRQGSGFTGAFGPPSLATSQIRTFPVESSTTCSIPSLAQAYSFNITAVPQAPIDWLTVYAATAGLQPAPPNVSTLNSTTGVTVANAAIVEAGTDGYGGVDVYTTGNTDLIIDINGYYAPPDGMYGNFALGNGSLANNTTGILNTATGNAALAANTVGAANTAVGSGALTANTSGSGNTAVGDGALSVNTTGVENVALGELTMHNNTTGNYNTATGSGAMGDSVAGSSNTADGYGALLSNSLGNNNTASGADALTGNTTGSNNIAIGYQAALNVAAGNSNNIHVGNQGLATDSGTIRIGTGGTQTSFFAAAIRGVTTGSNDAIPVVIDSNGQLGTISSSRRFKEDIRGMGDVSSGLLQLRPVTFRYRQPFADGSKPVQYGLIAEEAEAVYPDLVAHSADGKIESVKYQMLDSMLLNELQKQATRIEQQTEQNRQQAEKIRSLEERLAAVEAMLPKAAAPDRR